MYSYFQSIVENRLDSARFKFPDMHSAHEAYAVILEEMDEFWEEVKKKQEDRNLAEMCSELADVAAMCQRAAEDLKLINCYIKREDNK